MPSSTVSQKTRGEEEHKMMLQVAIISLAAPLVSSQYAPVEKLPPQPYSYEYGVADDYSKTNFKKTETQDAKGVVTGSFTIALPDGRIQTTSYTADHVNGFVAEVFYSGEPIYPPEPKGGYGHSAPVAFKPAPAYNGRI